MTKDRRETAYEVRLNAAQAARNRTHPDHEANGDEQRYADVCYPMSFTKGLKHDSKTGLVADAGDFEAFRTAVDNGFIDPFTLGVRVPPETGQKERRQWEAPTAGVVYDLQGPDAQAVTMPPAPALGSAELAYEMAEVYELALVRDVPFTEFADTGGGALQGSLDRLNGLSYTTEKFPGRPRINTNGQVTKQNVFRGSSPGVDVGPYLSQFMLIGNPDRAGGGSVAQGLIEYGANTIDQRVAVARPCKDYMMDKTKWRHVQDGYKAEPDDFTGARRFICTPRDLATYVHFDALYQAYLNACLILLGMKTPFDPAFNALSGGGEMTHLDKDIKRNAGGFALYGPPHILTLVTEVATRALKAVRYQKFNNHMRLRPEALAGRIACEKDITHAFPCFGAEINDLSTEIGDTLSKIEAHNQGQIGTATRFLPMAFPEGSPMHPAYGAGHATVAGACVTVLKAFFDTSAVFVKPHAGADPVFKTLRGEGKGEKPNRKKAKYANIPVAFAPECHPAPKVKGKGKGKRDELPKCLEGCGLGEVDLKCPLTLEGELNKLAANISIGRNMAGVHYFTDYYDSLRMGEEIAIGMLEEQALCYPTDRYVMSVPTFDGKVRRIGER
ncbi:MAG: vanadium-dependent haloperoxidase [Pseudomonadota bacterium]